MYEGINQSINRPINVLIKCMKKSINQSSITVIQLMLNFFSQSIINSACVHLFFRWRFDGITTLCKFFIPNQKNSKVDICRLYLNQFFPCFGPRSTLLHIVEAVDLLHDVRRRTFAVEDAVHGIGKCQLLEPGDNRLEPFTVVRGIVPDFCECTWGCSKLP